MSAKRARHGHHSSEFGSALPARVNTRTRNLRYVDLSLVNGEGRGMGRPDSATEATLSPPSLGVLCEPPSPATS